LCFRMLLEDLAGSSRCLPFGNKGAGLLDAGGVLAECLAVEAGFFELASGDVGAEPLLEVSDRKSVG